MNILEGVEVSIWDTVGGNRLLSLILILAVWTFICVLLTKILSKKPVSIIAGVGSLVLIGYWIDKTFQ